MFRRPLAPSSGHVLSGPANVFVSEFEASKRLWQWKTRGSFSKQTWQRTALANTDGKMTFPHRFPESERAATWSHGIVKGAIFKPIRAALVLPLLSHLLGAQCLGRTGCVCTQAGGMKMLGVCAELCSANWQQEGTYAKSHSTWPLNLDKLSISCTRGAFSLHALV